MVKNTEEYIFKCLLNNLISSIEKYIFNLLGHLMIKCFWRNVIFGVLYRLEIPVRQIAGKVILLSWNCLFSLLNASLPVQIFNFMQYLWILKVSPMPLGPFSESPYLSIPGRVLPMFPLSSFRLSSFTSQLFDTVIDFGARWNRDWVSLSSLLPLLKRLSRWMGMCHKACMGVRQQVVGVESLLPPSGF